MAISQYLGQSYCSVVRVCSVLQSPVASSHNGWHTTIFNSRLMEFNARPGRLWVLIEQFLLKCILLYSSIASMIFPCNIFYNGQQCEFFFKFIYLCLFKIICFQLCACVYIILSVCAMHEYSIYRSRKRESATLEW